MQARIGGAGAQEALGKQVDPLLAAEATGVEDLQLARVGGRPGLGGIKARGINAALPAADPRWADAELKQRAIGSWAR